MSFGSRWLVLHLEVSNLQQTFSKNYQIFFLTGGDNESLDSFALRENVTIAEDDSASVSLSQNQGAHQVCSRP